MVTDKGLKLKTVIIAAPAGAEAKNILRTDIFDMLKANNLRMVILTPTSNEDYFAREFVGDNIVYEKMLSPTWLSSLFYGLRFGWFIAPAFTRTIEMKIERLRQERPFFSLPARIIGFLGRLKMLRSLIEKMGLALFPAGAYGEIYKKYQPVLVFITYRFNPFDPYLFPLLLSSKRYKVPVLCLVPSWDNLTSKGRPILKADRLIVWNEINKQEAVELHGYSPEDVDISGAPQFDIYFKKEGIFSREEFFSKMGADPAKKLLVYTTTSSTTSDADPEVIEIIKRYINENKFSCSCQLLVRTHPMAQYENRLYEHLQGNKDIIFDTPELLSATYGEHWDATTGDMVHLANLMQHADVEINIASTITIEACIFDTPVVNVGFDGYRQKPYRESNIRFGEFTHYSNIIKTGGVKVAESKEELLQYINDYLENPGLDREGRRKIVAEQCYYTDGKSGERVANYLLDFLNHIGEGSDADNNLSPPRTLVMQYTEK